jgi:predicted transposase/invertase (TIGR01784 family)
VEEAINMDRAIQKAQEKMAYVASDKEALRVYQMREMALSDWTSGINHARREGIQEGIEKGIEKGRREGKLEGRLEGRLEEKQEIARNLKALGIPLEQIVQITGLTEDQIREL